MYKKDIYEHLAKIYLDASSKKKKKSPQYLIFKNPSVVIAIIFVLGIFLFASRSKSKSDAALILQPGTVKINLNFNPSKVEVYAIDLNRLDLTKFKTLGFSIRKVNQQDNLFLRIGFISAFKEKSEVYLKNISHKWQDYKISLADFKNIKNWSEMLGLSFIIEERNVKKKEGVLYIDNVRFLR